ncbi:MAG: triose-phosphate isomerase [Candidatus Nealsonbacteria bacterium]
MKPLIIANWKMNPQTLKEAKELFKLIERAIENIKEIETIVCPPFVYLSELKSNSNIKIGAQNCFYEEKGAFTGEISLAMLKDLGCQYVIVGHSERRKYFNETDEIINKKLKVILEVGLKPILCIGETQEQRDKGETEKVLKNQLEINLKNITILNATLSIAYEPIWAIGTGNPCSSEDAKKALLFIKKIIDVPVLYGGSVNKENTQEYIKKAGFNGLLVGGASLKADEFIQIIKNSI